jgi:cystathionine beta-lyase/cystathionine gamma-synthase
MKTPNEMRLDTKLIHAGEPTPRILGAVAMPVFQSSTFEYAGESSYHEVRYIRQSNTPNHLALHGKLAALEGAEAALVASTGMAAISTTLLTLLSPGDHLLVQRCVYGGTRDFVMHELPRLGIAVSAIDAGDPSGWKAELRPATRAIWVEAITNPLLEVADLAGVVAFARANRLVSAIDATFASPVNFRPIEHGFDLVMHSASKYLNGHTDLVAGAIMGSAERIAAIKRRLDLYGGALDPHACHLLHRGLKTLAVRVRQQNASALAIAKHLSAHRAVARVHYPGLEIDPGYARARALFAGCGGVLAFELRGGVAAADRALARSRLAACAPSLGGVDSLITRPATTSHAGLSAEERRRIGIGDGLVRLSVGLEAPEDLIADLEQMLAE